MHLFIGTRGIKNSVDAWIRDLQAQYYTLLNSKNINQSVQMSVRPIQLWELVFPKEHFQEVLRSVEFPLEDGIMASQGHLDKYMILMRKLLKAKKIPPIEPGPRRILAPRDRPNIQVVGLGYKEDADLTTDDGLTFEGL